MKGLFRSRPRMGKLGPWDEESDVDDPVVSEDRPWSLESSDPDISTSESLSPEDDDSKESSSLEAIRTQNKVPRFNAELNFTAKTYRNEKKEDKGNPFYSPITRKRKKKLQKMNSPVKEKLPK